MTTGVIKWYDPDKGFGFIARDDGGNDLFLHHTVVNGQMLADGDRVEFTIGQGPKGERAENLHLIMRSGNPPRARRIFETPASPFALRSRSTRPGSPFGGLGTIRRFDSDRGFGFIAQDDDGEDVFFHGSRCSGGIPGTGDRVEFTAASSERGPRADQVRILDRSRSS